VVNGSARQALVDEHRSLLPAGLVAVEGPFQTGETVSLRTEDGREFARGLVSCDWQDAQRVMGLHTANVASVLGRPGVDELVHRDNLVILSTG